MFGDVVIEELKIGVDNLRFFFLHGFGFDLGL